MASAFAFLEQRDLGHSLPGLSIPSHSLPLSPLSVSNPSSSLESLLSLAIPLLSGLSSITSVPSNYMGTSIKPFAFLSELRKKWSLHLPLALCAKRRERFREHAKWGEWKWSHHKSVARIASLWTAGAAVFSNSMTGKDNKKVVTNLGFSSAFPSLYESVTENFERDMKENAQTSRQQGRTRTKELQNLRLGYNFPLITEKCTI